MGFPLYYYCLLLGLSLYTMAFLFSNPPPHDTTKGGGMIPVVSTSFGGVWSRPFPVWPDDRPLPCFDPKEAEDPLEHEASSVWTNVQQGGQWKQKLLPTTTQGLFYLKLMKTASSTAASVHLRVARNLAARQQHWNNKEDTTNTNTSSST
jgi:hypothetical protein